MWPVSARHQNSSPPRTGGGPDRPAALELQRRSSAGPASTPTRQRASRRQGRSARPKLEPGRKNTTSRRPISTTLTEESAAARGGRSPSTKKKQNGGGRGCAALRSANVGRRAVARRAVRVATGDCGSYSQPAALVVERVPGASRAWTPPWRPASKGASITTSDGVSQRRRDVLEFGDRVELAGGGGNRSSCTSTARTRSTRYARGPVGRPRPEQQVHGRGVRRPARATSRSRSEPASGVERSLTDGAREAPDQSGVVAVSGRARSGQARGRGSPGRVGLGRRPTPATRAGSCPVRPRRDRGRCVVVQRRAPPSRGRAPRWR